MSNNRASLSNLPAAEYLIAQKEVDFQTIRALLNKTKESPSFETVQKIDSQKFYKSVMWCDYNVTKYGMKTIVEYFRDGATKKAYTSGAHGALCDAKALCSVSTSPKLYDRFKDWLLLEQSVEEEEEVSSATRLGVSPRATTCTILAKFVIFSY